ALPPISKPLLVDSLKPAIKLPDAGHIKPSPLASPPLEAADVSATGVTGVTTGAVAPTGGRVVGCTVVVATGRAPCVASATTVPGGATRTTCPTSIKLGLDRLLQRAISFQL